MAEALRLLEEADFESGSVEERVAALAEARRRIWEIADRAGADSASILLAASAPAAGATRLRPVLGDGARGAATADRAHERPGHRLE
jgi:hypothetical protein